MLFSTLGMVIVVFACAVVHGLTLRIPGFVEVVVLAYSYFVMIHLIHKYRQMGLILSLGILLRLLVLFVDVHYQGGFTVPISSGGDSQNYFNAAVMVSRDLAYLGAEVYGGLYSKLTGLLFYFVGPSRMIAQLFNLFFWLLGSLVILTELNRRNIGKASWVMMVNALFPMSIILTSILLRESIISLLNLMAIYVFVLWLEKEKYLQIAVSILLVVVSAAFHSGSIFLLVVMIPCFAFYSPRKRSFSISFKQVVTSFVVMIVGGLLIISVGQVIFGKFSLFTGTDEVISYAARSRGQSAYLTGISPSNPIALAAFIVLKGFYLLASPLPWDWRAMFDIIAFMMDGALYLAAFAFLWKDFIKRWKAGERVIPIGAVMLTVFLLLFGMGVSNAGTALRHRYKIYFIFVLLVGVWGLAQEKWNKKREIKDN